MPNTGSAYDGRDPTENVKALNEASVAGLRREITLEVAGLRREIENQAKLVDKTREIDRQNQMQIDEKLQTGTDKLAAAIELTAKTLSANVAETAKTLSSSAAETAKSIASQLEGTFGRLADRVAVLERGQYEGAGQAGERDPQIKALMAEVAALRTEQNKESGKSAGLSLGWAILMGALGLIVIVLGLLPYVTK